MAAPAQGRAAIDYSRLRNLTARELIRALERDGFRHTHSSGAHHRYHHPDGRQVTVSFHRSGDTFKPGTLKSIIERQAQWDEADLKRLKLMN